MTASSQTDTIQPNLIGLLDLLDHYLEVDEEKHAEAVVEAALAADTDDPRRLGVERYSLNMVRESRLEVAVLKQQIWAVMDRLAQQEGTTVAVQPLNLDEVLF